MVFLWWGSDLEEGERGETKQGTGDNRSCRLKVHRALRFRAARAGAETLSAFEGR